MKKLFAGIIVIGAFIGACTTAAVGADVMGEVYSTDIGTRIDGNPIRSYNISDSTYIKAEDLRGHGFDVNWDETARTLSIVSGGSGARTILPEEDLEILKADVPIHQKLYDVYYTDIKTYLDGTEIAACNIDGETLVKLADLSGAGYVDYDDTMRLATLDTIKYQLDKEFETAEDKSELDLGDGITYVGQVSDGKPNGIGIKYDKSQLTGYPGTVNDITTTAEFTDGEISGMYYISGSYRFTVGSDRSEYSKLDFGDKRTNYNVLRSNYYTVGNFRVSTVDGMEQYCENGAQLYSDEDSSYLYCIEPKSYTTYTDGDENIAQQSEDMPEIVRIAHGMAVSADGRLFSLPYNENTKASVAVMYNMPDYYSMKVKDGCIEDNPKTDWFLTEDGHLYAVPSDGECECVAENVKEATCRHLYVSNDGELFEYSHSDQEYYVVDTDVASVDGDSYIAYLKNDGSLWTYRSEQGNNWMDGLDFSAPIKRADDVKAFSAESLTYLYVKSDGTLWGFGLSHNGELGYNGPSSTYYDGYSEILSGEHKKLGDDFESCEIGSGYCMAKKSNGDLYEWGKDSGETPEKTAENVRDYTHYYANYIVKTDGTLYVKGSRTAYSAFRDGVSTVFDEYTPCTTVYSR